MLLNNLYKKIFSILSIVIMLCSFVGILNADAQNTDIHSSELVLKDENISRSIDSLLNYDVLEAYNFCEKELSQITYFEEPVLFTNLLLHQSVAAYLMGNTVFADSLKDELFSIKLDNIHPVIRGDILLNKSRMAVFYDDNINAIKYGKKALAIFENNNTAEQLGATNVVLGLIYYKMGKYDISYNYYKEALKVYDKECFREKYSNVLLSSIKPLDELKEYQTIHEYLSEAKENALILNNRKLLGIVYYQSANYYLGRKNYIYALQLYEKAEQIFIKENIIIDLSTIYTKRAFISGQSSDFKKAIEYNKKAALIRAQTHSEFLMASSQYNIAGSFIGQGMNDSALYYIQRGEELYGPYRHSIHFMRAMDLKIRIYLDRNQYKKAFKTLEEKMKLQDAFFKSQNDRRFKEMKSDFQMGQFEEYKKLKLAEVKMHKTQLERDQLISRVVLIILILVSISSILLYLFNRSRNERNIVLTSQKIIFLQLNSHFIFNALTAIQSLVFQKKIESAIHHLTIFSDLINKIICETQRKYVPLKNDVLFIKNFLQLQELRFGDVLKYEFNIDDELDLDQMMVPPVLIYPFIEYAVEECVQKSGGQGELVINIKNERKYIVYELIDKGLGYINLDLCFIKRYAGQEVLCEQLTNERLSIYNTFYKTKIIFAKKILLVEGEKYHSLSFRIKK